MDKLGIKFIGNYSNENSWKYVDSWEIISGAEGDLYFQLINESRDGIRYIADAGTTIAVNLSSTDNDGNTTTLEKAATIADNRDESIYFISVAAGDGINNGPVSLSVTTNGNTVTHGGNNTNITVNDCNIGRV